MKQVVIDGVEYVPKARLDGSVELPQWHPGAQIRPGHPEDAAIQVDKNWEQRWKETNTEG
jgi:hypothetical protein